MKTYIAGPMTGYPEFNRSAFMAEAQRQTDKGHIVLNPAIWPDGLTQAEYMQLDIAMVIVAERTVMLPNWRDSAGACSAHALATKLGHEIEYVADTPTGETLRHTVEPTGDDWIEWKGGECPVSGETEVATKFKSGINDPGTSADLWNWAHDDPNDDHIVAYRVVKS